MAGRVKVASYNIHGWVDADMQSNLERVAGVVAQHDPDILCLQEVYACWELPCLLEFLRRSVFEHVVRWEGCAVLSKRAWRLEEHSAPRHPLERAPGFSFNRPRYLTVKVAREEQPGEALFYLTCIHLVPKYSDLRHEEIIRISEDLGSLAARREAQLWCGDFNTLSRGDYTAAEWAEILRVRRDNGRRDPDPDNNVIQTIHSLGFTDNWVAAGRPEPRTTSRFATRVDYIFSSETFARRWRLLSLGHHPHDASDHSFVIAEFAEL